jgi:hypothetical protein
VEQDGTAPEAGTAGRVPRADVWHQLLAERRSPSDPPPATIRGLYVGTIPPKSEGDPVLVTLRDADGGADAGDRVTPPIVIPEPPPTHSRVRARSRRARSVWLVAAAAAVGATLFLALRQPATQAEPPPLSQSTIGSSR